MNVALWWVQLGPTPSRLRLDRIERMGCTAQVAPPMPIEEMEKTLSPEESARAQRLPNAELRRRFVTSRGTLRWVLSSYLGIDRERIEFAEGSGEKPRIANPGYDLNFNLSHSKDLGLIAVSQGREVGVDLEWKDPNVPAEKLSRKFFAEEEKGFLSTSEGDSVAISEEFFRIWTLREAYLKGLGLGLSVPLTGFAVSGPGVEPPKLLRSDYGNPRAWTLRSFSLADQYCGAVALQRLDDPSDSPVHPRGSTTKTLTHRGGQFDQRLTLLL